MGVVGAVGSSGEGFLQFQNKKKNQAKMTAVKSSQKKTPFTPSPILLISDPACSAGSQYLACDCQPAEKSLSVSPENQ